MSGEREVGVGVVTGGARGIGYAVAERLAARGARLVLVDRLEEPLAEARKRLAAETACFDVTDRGSLHEVLRRAAKPGHPVLLAHAAGVSPTLASADEIFRINFGSTLSLVEAAEQSLSGGSAIVVIASVAGHFARGAWLGAVGDATEDGALDRLCALTDDPNAAYGISKLAVMELVRRKALPLGRRGIRINSVSPNITNTPMGQSEISEHPIIDDMLAASPISRIAEADEIAAVVDFLLSPGASYVTGADVLVDGGCLANFAPPA